MVYGWILGKHASVGIGTFNVDLTSLKIVLSKEIREYKSPTINMFSYYISDTFDFQTS